ncbi:MAG: PqqD family peptide modification chaperone [Chloroflexota bacterium]
MTQDVQISLETTVVQTEEILSTDIDDEIVLMSLTTDKYYGLDPVSTRIWQLLAEPSQLATVQANLLQEFEVDAETCQSDLLTFVQKLFDAQLIEIVDG